MLTKNLLQLHNTGIGSDAMNGLCLLQVASLFKDLRVSSIPMGTLIVVGGHVGCGDGKFELVELARNPRAGGFFLLKLGRGIRGRGWMVG
jgi:hypothetical protein